MVLTSPRRPSPALILVMMLVLCIPYAANAETLTLTPEAAVEIALKNNSSIAVERFEPALRRADIQREKGAFDPVFAAGVGRQSLGLASGTTYSVGLEHRLGFGATYGIEHTRGTDFLGQGASQTSLNLRVPLLRGSGAEVNRAGVNTAIGLLEVSELELGVTALDLAFEVEASYWALVLAHRVADVRVRAVEQAEAFLKLLETEIELGAAAPYELYEAEQNLASRQADVRAAEGDVVVARQRLLRLMGRQKTEVIVSADIPAIPLLEQEEYEEEALSRRPLLKAAEKDRELLVLQEKVARNQALPQLDLVASHNISGSGLNPYSWQAGVQLSLPIGNHEGKGRVNRAKAAQEQALANIEDLRQRVILEVAQAYATVQSTALQTEAARRAVVSSEERVEAESERFSAGFSAAHRVILAQQQQLTVNEEFVAAQIRGQIAFVSLKRASGTILQLPQGGLDE